MITLKRIIFIFSQQLQQKIKMGSSFSIYNDTKYDIWVWQSENMDAILWPTVAVLTVATAGAGLAASGVGAGAAAGSSAAIAASTGTVAFGSAASVASASATTLGLTAGQWTITNIALGLGSGALERALHVTKAEASKLEENIRRFKEGCHAILKPGQTYTFDSSLSMSRWVYLMNENADQISRTCWTGATAGSNITYKVSKDFAWSRDVIVWNVGK